MERSPTLECALCDDGGLSKDHIARHNSPTPLVSHPAGEVLIGFYNHCGTREGPPYRLPTGFVTSRPGGIYAVIGCRLFHELKSLMRFKFSCLNFCALQVFVFELKVPCASSQLFEIWKTRHFSRCLTEEFNTQKNTHHCAKTWQKLTERR